MAPDELDLRTRIQPLRPSQPGAGSRTERVGPGDKKTDFTKVLAGELATRSEPAGAPEKAAGIEFSAHARARLLERNITLSPNNMARLDHGVRLANDKGSANTLVLMDDNAFIVNVKNKRVITAITKESAVDNVFTQIDSATIV